MPKANVGELVFYHGSIEAYHNRLMVVEGLHQEVVPTHGEYSPVRYVLRYGKGLQQALHNVRPESFTLYNNS